MDGPGPAPTVGKGASGELRPEGLSPGVHPFAQMMHTSDGNLIFFAGQLVRGTDLNFDL